MSKCGLLTVGFGGLLLATTTWAQQLPPGYQGVIQITNDDAYNDRPAINNRGQLVFAKRFDPHNGDTSEIFLYDMASGELSRITFDNVRDDFPDINDAGEMVWSRAIGVGGTFEIVLWRETQLTRLTFDDLKDSSPQINNTGLIAWNKFTDEGCREADADIYVYDGESIQPITFGGFSNQSEHVNDLGDIVWTRYNFCNYPWTSQIMMYSGGVITPLTHDQGEVQVPRINNHGLVGWQHAEAPDWNKEIHLWQDGITSVLTDWGGALSLNNRGDVVFDRWHDDSQTWQVWLYLNHTGEFYQLTDDAFWNDGGDINDHGDVAWMGGPIPVSLVANIKLLSRFPSGDMNCDGVTDAFDIDPFVLALTDQSMYESIYPDCDYLLADIDADGAVDAFDIDPFVELLVGS